MREHVVLAMIGSGQVYKSPSDLTVSPQETAVLNAAVAAATGKEVGVA